MCANILNYVNFFQWVKKMAQGRNGQQAVALQRMYLGRPRLSFVVRLRIPR